MKRTGIDHPILDSIEICLANLEETGMAEMTVRATSRESECVEFTDDDGDWEIVVRRIKREIEES